MEEFDLLARYQDGESTMVEHHGPEVSQVLLWKKIEVKGHIPAGREGHTSVAVDGALYTFGGLEGGKRVNSTIKLDLIKRAWNLLKVSGALPAPRCNHASVLLDQMMVIHGGEGLKGQKSGNVSEEEEPLSDFPSSTLDGQGNPSRQMVIPSKLVPGQLPGVCPGDTLQGLKLGPSVKVQKVVSHTELIPTETQPQQTSTSQVMSCFDDLFLFDLVDHVWYDIKSNLAPLPRKGHSMNLANLGTSGDSSKQCLLVFGGFSTDNLTVSNTVLACFTDPIRRYVQKSQQILADGKKISDYEQQAAGSKVKRAYNEKYDLQPIVWRTLPCRGTAPAGRFRHSSSIVRDNSGADLLVIIGGIGLDQSRPLNDVHILQCDTMTWLHLESHQEGLAKRISIDGPFNGIYGHSAFPFFHAGHHNPQLSLLDNEESKLQNSDEHQEIIVFGGSYDTASSKSSCYPGLFAYNYRKDIWRRVSTGHSYPISRTGHSCVVLPGWSPSFDTPFGPTKTTAATATNKSLGTPKLSAVGGAGQIQETSRASLPVGDYTRCSVLIFGGVTAAMTVQDLWALDLQYRDAGLDQYDNNTHQVIQATMRGWEEGNQAAIAAASGGLLASGVGEDSLVRVGELQLDDTKGAYGHLQQQQHVASSTNLHLQKSSSAHKIHSVNDSKYLAWKKSPTGQTLQQQQQLQQTRGMLPRDSLISQSLPTMHLNLQQSNNNQTADHNHPSSSNKVGLVDGTNHHHQTNNSASQLSFRAPNEYLMMETPHQPQQITPSHYLQTPTNHHNNNQTQVEYESEIIMKFKRERAITEIQLSQERSRVQQLTQDVHSLLQDQTQLTTQLAETSQRYEDELSRLRAQLTETQERARELTALNEEAYALLAMYGIDRMKHR